MRFLSTLRILRVTLAFAVALWMAGAGCLLGCENMATALAESAATPSQIHHTVVAGDACASMKAHDCCAAKAKPAAMKPATIAKPISAAKSKTPVTLAANGSNTELSGTSSSMMDCPMAVNGTAVLSRTGQDQSNSDLLLTQADGHISHLKEQAKTLSPPLRVPNRGHTYLRCCVFLI